VDDLDVRIGEDGLMPWTREGDWEFDDANNVKRLIVPGGWVYMWSTAQVVFVPEPQGEKVPAPDQFSELQRGFMDATRAVAIKEMIDDLLQAQDFYQDGEPTYASKRINKVIDQLEALLPKKEGK
jgi:hypothetical protein